MTFLDNSYDKGIIKSKRIDLIKIQIILPKRTIQRIISFDTSGNITHILTLNEKKEKTSETIIKYDTSGNPNLRYDFEDKLNDTTRYVYNNKKLVKKTTSRIGGKFNITIYLYRNDTLTEETIKGEENLTKKYKYDLKGRLINFKITSPDIFSIKEMNISYGINGLKSIEELTYFVNAQIKYTYAKSNRLIKVENDYAKEVCGYYYTNELLFKKEVYNVNKIKQLAYKEFYSYSFRH
jgi:hypothetical protein